MIPSILTASEIAAALGARLREHRLARNLAQAELAGMAGISTATLKRIEKSGQCSMDAFVRLTKALGLAGEFDRLFAQTPVSIAQMERAQAAAGRKRASRRATR